MPGNPPDGPIFRPGIFLDARTAAGTAPSRTAARCGCCAAAVPWWSTGGRDAPVWHTVDLRTV